MRPELAWLPPGAPLDLYHQVQLRRQHLPAAQDAHHGLVHRAGRPRVVHLVEALHGLVLVVLAALQQVTHGHGAAVVVPLAKTGVLAVRSGRRQRVGGVRVSDSEGDLDRLGVDERGAAGQRNAADPRGGGREGAQQAGKILRVVPCGHVVGVAGFQLVVQALHQLILCSGCDYLHASLHVAQHSFSLVRRRRVDVSGQLVIARRRQAALAS